MPPRRPHRLPGQITAMMAATILVFGITLAASVLWLASALDHQSRRDSGRLLVSALSSIESEVASVNLEYTRWDDLVIATEAGDVDWLYRNVGVTAASSLLSDMAVLWGGPLEEDIGWIDGSPASGLARIVAPTALDRIDQRLQDEVPLQVANGVSFYLWRGNDLFVSAASRIEWSYDVSRAETDDARIPRLLFGRRVGRDLMSRIAETTLLGELRITRTAPHGEEAAPLRGPDGRAVAWLVWQAPRPGTAMLGRMAPILLPITLLATGLGLMGMILSARGARACPRRGDRARGSRDRPPHRPA